MGEILVGKKEIANFVKRSWTTVEKWIKKKNFPAWKEEGRWESDGELIRKWRIKQAENNNN